MLLTLTCGVSQVDVRQRHKGNHAWLLLTCSINIYESVIVCVIPM